VTPVDALKAMSDLDAARGAITAAQRLINGNPRLKDEWDRLNAASWALLVERDRLSLFVNHLDTP